MKMLIAVGAALLLAACWPTSPPPSTPAPAQNLQTAAEPARTGADEAALMGLAEQHYKLATRYKTQLEQTCRQDVELPTQIVRDSIAATDAWLALDATDYAKIIRQACLNALGDVSVLASNCMAPKYNTYDAAAKERHYKEDIAECRMLLQHPPPLGSKPE